MFPFSTFDFLRLNFSDLEIEIFCAKYDKDGDFEFNLEEINAIEQDLGEQFENFDHLVLKKNNGSNGDESYDDGQNGPKMTKREFDE